MTIVRSVAPAVFFLALGTVFFSTQARALEKPLVLSVWPGMAPGEKGDIGDEKLMPPQAEKKPIQRLANVSKPTITVYSPDKEKNTGAAVLICPGGGYSILAMDLEGEEVAQWLNSIGATGIVLKYRVPARKDRPRHEPPLQDAQRAMSLVREHAKTWGIDPARIGILGFSAGGHLSAVASTNYAQRKYAPIDDVDKVSCRPDFTVLVYPAYLTTKEGSLSPDLPVDARTPPMFFVHASDDGISSENSLALYSALKKAKVPAEMHVYASGGHGFGLRPSDRPCSAWPQRCAEWMKSSGLLERKSL
jgi:acetyl esterase/lipase